MRFENYDDVVVKLKSGEKLNESEISTLVWDGIRVDEIELGEGRWTKGMKTIIDIDNELWAIDWSRGLTECQENEYYNQPYRVEKIEKEITVIDVTYKRIED